jgi:hypothetical protein
MSHLSAAKRRGCNPENRTRVILSDSEGSAFFPYSYRIGIVSETKIKSRFFVAPLLRMTLRHGL